ncbi:MAG: type II toxin-antitoxin system HipA family toxin [Gemmatimonadota bacterium]
MAKAERVETRAEVEVRLWGHRVGALVELESGVALFEYAEDFRRTGLEISPVHLPLRLRGPLRFDHLKSDTFERLPGVFADSLPDAFGRKVIRAYWAAEGREEELTALQKLLYVGTRAIGALTYHPARELPDRLREVQALELRALAHDASQIVQGRAEVAVPEIYRLGSSAGGVRPKAVVRFDPSSREIWSGFDDIGEGRIPAILKFDGVGEDATEDRLGAPQHYNRVEATYARMAEGAGIDVTTLEILEDDGHAHLLVFRFDLGPEGERLHQHTLGGLIHVDYNDPGASSYEEYLRRILGLGMPYASLAEGYRRALFNVLGVNQDDHVKNLSFHMFPDGRWTLTPAYDLTFARGAGFTSRHQMSLRGKREAITERDLTLLGEELGISRPERIIAHVRDAVSGFRAYAKDAGVPADVAERIEEVLQERDREVFGG